MLEHHEIGHKRLSPYRCLVQKTCHMVLSHTRGKIRDRWTTLSRSTAESDVSAFNGGRLAHVVVPELVPGITKRLHTQRETLTAVCARCGPVVGQIGNRRQREGGGVSSGNGTCRTAQRFRTYIRNCRTASIGIMHTERPRQSRRRRGRLKTSTQPAPMKLGRIGHDTAS